MKNRLFVILLLTLPSFFLTAQYNPNLVNEVKATVASFKAQNAKFDTFFADAYGYVVFPKVGKGAYFIGGARGKGIVFEQGQAIGIAKITQITIGLQMGGQAYSQLIFFETKDDLQRIKENQLEFAGQASAVLIEEGASVDLAYSDGVAIFTQTKGGLMFEASLGGQKIKYKANKKKVTF